MNIILGIFLITGIIILAIISTLIFLFCIHVTLYVAAWALIAFKKICKFLHPNSNEGNSGNEQVYNIQKIKNIKDFAEDFYISWIPVTIVSKIRKNHLVNDADKKHYQGSKKNTPHMVDKETNDKVNDISHDEM